MLTPATFPQHCAQLTNPKITPEARRNLVAEVRDSIELVHSQEYSSFLQNFLPAFKVVLSDLATPQHVDNTIHKTRAIILEILNRLPHNNVLREKILDVFNMAMDTLKNDNEDNAVTALHIIFDLHKNDRHHLGGQVQPFLDFVRCLYESFGKTVETLLMAPASTPSPPKPNVQKISPSTQSFKVITECPLLVMFVFQLYPSLIQPNIQRLLPLMVRAMLYTVPVQIIPATSKQVFQEFIASQVKTVSFLAYLLKQFPDAMKADELSIPRSVVKLMQTCPGDSVAIRKELLVATRHILTSRFRQGFFDQIDLLLDERILVGTGRAGPAILRPLGYSFLAELVHCVRLSLSIPQLEKIIFLFSANVHDPKFSYTLQTNSVRLLLNLIEGILKVDPADATQRPAARELLIRILETLVSKYVTLGEQVPRLLESVVSMRREPDPVAKGKRLSEVPLGDPLKEIADFKTLLKTLTLGLKTVIWSAINIRVPQANASKSTPSANLATGAQQRKSAAPGRQSIRTGLLEKECEIVSRLLPAGRNCFRLYSRHEKANGTPEEALRSQAPEAVDGRKKSMLGGASDPTSNSVPDMLSEYTQAADPARIIAASPQEEREVFDQFAQIFTVLDPPSFQDVFGQRIADLFEYIVENGTAITIPQHFLANSSVSKYFADILFNFLVENMGYLDVPYQDTSQKYSNEGKRANCLLKLFKILFASVSLFPTNEPVLRLHLQSIVKNCLNHAGKARDPHAFLQMLRALFKSITSGKHEVQFEVLYRDFMPLVEPIFSHLLSLYAGPSRLLHRELIIELCLMVPARPSTIFPYLEQQIKPIVWALEGGRENPMYGLRTLEFWVDKLQPGYLRLLLSKVEPDLTRALHRHLRPPGNAFGPGALRILGKLGARSRSQKLPTLQFRLKENAEYAQRLSVEWQDGLQLNLETDEVISLACDALLDQREKEAIKYTAKYKAQAWKFLFGCLCPFLGFQDSAKAVQLQSSGQGNEQKWYLSDGSMAGKSRESSGFATIRKEVTPKEASTVQLASTILQVLLASAKVPELNEESISIMSSESVKGAPEETMKVICKYFALLSAQEFVHREENGGASGVNIMHQRDERNCLQEPQLTPNVFVDALVEAASLENRQQAESSLEWLRVYVKEIIGFCTAKESSSETEAPQMGTANTAGDTPDPPSAEQQGLQARNMILSMNRGGDQNVDVDRKDSDAMEIENPEKGENTEKEKAKNENPQGGESSHGDVVRKALAPLTDRLCHNCHGRTWNARWAGVHGLEVLISSLPFNVLTSLVYRPWLTRSFAALLFLARDTSDFGNDGTVSLASKVLQEIIRALYHHPLQPQTALETHNSSLHSEFADNACRILASDLTSASPNARQTAKICFGAIAKAARQEEADIVMAVRDRILKPLQERPIRQHGLRTQIGYLDAINFCLQFKKPIVSNDLFSAPLKEYVLVESMHIMDANNLDPSQDADDGFRAKYHENKYLDADITRRLVFLRRKVLDFLCNVSEHCSSALQDRQHERIFRLMISCFFRSLQSRDEEMVRSAKRGLKHAICNHPKPKELLQHNLRPLLGNLGDYKKLTLQYLQGLNRVLELFSHWFNVNLGEKLLEHLQRWTEPEKIPPLKKMMAGSESKVAAAILDLFHLLPAAASKFMEQIVNMVLKLESVIALAAPGAAHLGLKNAMGACTSPYRTPLLKYSNQHAAVASKYFLAHLDDERIRQLFFVMIRSTESAALRKDLMQMPQRLLSISRFTLDDNTGKSLHVITLIDLLSRHEPSWLKADAELMVKLSSFWKLVLNASEIRQNNSQSLSRVRAVKMLAEIFIRYCRQFPEEINVLFDLLPVFSTRTICDFTFVKDFLHTSVTKPSLHSNRKAILTRFLAIFQDKSQSHERKVQALQYIVIPMVRSHLESKEKGHEKSLASDRQRATDFSSERNGNNSRSSNPSLPSRPAAGQRDGTTEKGPKPSSHQNGKPAADEFLDAALIQRIMKELLDQPDAVLRDYEEPVSAELLRLATLLIQYMPNELSRYRKELIKFGWNHLKREDSIAKHWAFVNVSRFFEAYQAPVKIILQVYVALLRACQGDGKELVQQALDILTPALPLRLVHNPSDHKYPIWIRYTKKILLEEGHSVPNLVHIWQLIARHPNLFYGARAQFVPVMVNSLSRIGLNTAPPTENRRLALDLVHLILSWEKTRRANTRGPSSAKKEVSSRSPVTKKRPREEESKPAESELPEIPSESGRDSGSEPPTKTRKSEDSQAIAVSSVQDGLAMSQATRDADDFKLSPTMIDMLINFLTQILYRPMDRREAPVLTRRCISLLEDALSLWPDATVRLHFVEKVLAPIATEKSQASSAVGTATKGVTNPFSGDFGSGDAKSGGKGDAPKNEKMEQARLKRAAVRHSALMTSLLLARVLAKHLGKRFIEVNGSAVRSLVGPSLSEGSLQAASQFACLLEEVVRAYPMLVNLKPSKATAPHSSSEPTDMSVVSSKGGGSRRAPERKQEKSESGPHRIATNRVSDESGWLMKLASEIGITIESCLKSSDATKNHCGMVALRVFSAGTSGEFTRYQESLVKALHRMTKENLSGTQPPSSAGGGASVQGNGTSGPHRAIVTNDRGSSLAIIANARGSSGANSNQNQEKGQGNDNARGAKPSAGQKNGQQSSQEMRALLLCLSLLGENIATLEPGQRKTLFQLLWALIDRCVQVEVLLEIVRIVETWVFWKGHPRRVSPSNMKEPLSSKEKVQILLKMIIFERISGHGSQELMNAYLMVILRIFGGADQQDKRPELMPKLERAFMLGMKTLESPLRKKFFQIYDASVDPSLALRLNYVVAKQDWEHLSDTFWIKHATELILSAVKKNGNVRVIEGIGKFFVKSVKDGQSKFITDNEMVLFKKYIDGLSLDVITEPLLFLSQFDPEIAHKLWIMLVPKTWEKLSSTERMSLERSIALLLTKEYHQVQASWRRNNVQSLLESVGRCHPLPLLRPDVIRHLGSRWNAWHSALNYLERKETGLIRKLKVEENAVDDRQRNQIRADLEDVFDSQSRLFNALHERDYVAGLWKHRSKSRKTTEALCLEQIGLHTHAQETYSEALSEQILRSGSSYAVHQADDPGRTEIAFWEERWIECARKLCQWEVLTEFSRTIVNSKLLHECLWRLPDWSALKELLIKNPVEDGPQLKIYQAYVQLQENKLEVADNFITQGYLKAQEKFCSLPEASDLDASAPILVQFQQLVELQESTRILSELNALSRHGSGGVNVDQKVDCIRLILNTWRERLPSVHEPLSFWNDILTWRNHVHAVVVNVLDALKEAANAKVTAAQSQNTSTGNNRNAGANAQTAQVQAAAAIAQALSQQVLVMGVNETAWNVHRFAKACRKQGYPDVALYVLQKMYPFGTMELTEYFVKTKETARSFMDGPRGLASHVENGLHELNRCNMDHFNSRQKAQLFTIKGKLFMALGQEDDAVEAFSTALHTSPDVGSAWLAWGQYCDTMQERAAKSPTSFTNFLEQGTNENPGSLAHPVRSGPLAAELAFREAAVNCYIQAARFGSRKTRSHFPRVLRLLSVDLKSRLSRDSAVQTRGGISGQSGQNQTSTLVNGSTGSDRKAASQTNNTATELDSGARSVPPTKSQQAYKQGVSKVISAAIQDVPGWLWLPWIPQLVSMLHEKECHIIRPILLCLAKQYPQALFYPLKSFIEDRKQMDKPMTEMYKKAMKLSRPITAALKLSASPAQLTTAAKQTQVAKESVQRANQRFHALRKELENLEKANTHTEGTNEYAAHMSKKTHLKTELASTHRILEKCIHAFQAATQRQRQIQELITGIHSSQSGRQETGGSLGKPPTAKYGDGQEQKKHGDGSGKIQSPSYGANKSASQTSSVSADRTTGSITPFENADAVMTELVRNHQELHYDMDMIATEISVRLKPTLEENISNLMNNLLHQCYNLPIDGKDSSIVNALRKTLEDVGQKYFGVRPHGEAGVHERIPHRIASLRQAFQTELNPQTAKNFPKDIEGIISRLQRWERILQRQIDLLPLHPRVEDVSKYLAELNDSEVEVFGQYCEDEFSEPTIEKHVKITRFCSEIGVRRGPTSSCREFYVVGSDGNAYHFTAETGTKASVQIAEERMSQLYRLMNCWVFGRNCEAQRRRIQLSVPVLMSIGNKVRLVSNEDDTSSLAHVASQYLKAKESSRSDVIGGFRKLMIEGRERRKEVAGDNVDERNEVKGVKREAFDEICRTHMPEWCVSRFISSRMADVTGNFVFRKRLAETLGYASLVSYIVGVEARTPEKIMVSWKHGVGYEGQVRLLTKNMRIGGSSEGVPFRLTRNIEKALGRFGLSGPFFGCVASSLNALRENDKLLETWVDVLEREELSELVKVRVEGALKKAGSSVKIGQKEMESAKEKMLEDLVVKTKAGLRYRLHGKKESVMEMSEKLISRAKDVDKQLEMEFSWQPWL